MQKFDNRQRPILFEQSWSGREFKKREPASSKLSMPAHGTGAFTMWGPDLASNPDLQGKFPARLPYVTYSHARLDAYLAQESARREKVDNKANQLVRHGLATIHKLGNLVPLIALSETLPTKEAEKRHTKATKLINSYEYESSKDDMEDDPMPRIKLPALKDALNKRELPLGGASTTAEAVTEGSRESLQSEATEGMSDVEEDVEQDEEQDDEEDAGEVEEDDGEEEEQSPELSDLDDSPSMDTAQLRHPWYLPPSAGFLRAMRDPSHSDSGLSLKAALDVAMAKEM